MKKEEEQKPAPEEKKESTESAEAKPEEKKESTELAEAKPEEKKESTESAEAVVEETKLELEKDVITEIPVEEEAPVIKGGVDVGAWKPKTSIGQAIKAGTITNIDQVLDRGEKILEPKIVEVLIPGLQNDLLMIGQAKGKFGGGQRRIFRQTQKKTPEGNNPSFGCVAVVGNANGYVGVGVGKSKDTLPAREKAVRNAKSLHMSVFMCVCLSVCVLFSVSVSGS